LINAGNAGRERHGWGFVLWETPFTRVDQAQELVLQLLTVVLSLLVALSVAKRLLELSMQRAHKQHAA
jgi:hypothetical protein